MDNFPHRPYLDPEPLPCFRNSPPGGSTTSPLCVQALSSALPFLFTAHAPSW